MTAGCDPAPVSCGWGGCSRWAAHFVIDTGPDFRQQMLREKVESVDAVLFTHEHKDHVAGLDDIRAFNFRSKRDMDVYATPQVQDAPQARVPLCFRDNPIPGFRRFAPRTWTRTPRHWRCEVLPCPSCTTSCPSWASAWPIAYITDANAFSPLTWERLEGGRGSRAQCLAQGTPHQPFQPRGGFGGH